MKYFFSFRHLVVLGLFSLLSAMDKKFTLPSMHILQERFQHHDVKKFFDSKKLVQDLAGKSMTLDNMESRVQEYLVHDILIKLKHDDKKLSNLVSCIFKILLDDQPEALTILRSVGIVQESNKK